MASRGRPSAQKRTLARVATYDWLLMLHVTGAFLLLGGAVAAGVLNTLALRAERPSEIALLLGLIRVAVPMIGVGACCTLVFGLWLVTSRTTRFGELWIVVSLVLWVVASALGGMGGKHQEQAREVAERLAAAGDTSNAELTRDAARPERQRDVLAPGAATLAHPRPHDLEAGLMIAAAARSCRSSCTSSARWSCSARSSPR